MSIQRQQLKELLLQGLETELGGVQIYEHAVQCAVDGDLKEEWTEYLEQTRRHCKIARELCEAFSIDPEETTPGRDVVRHIGASLVQAIQKAQAAGDPSAAQRIAAECVVLAETKDHLDWELLGEAAKHLEGDAKRALTDACGEIEEQEDEHLYHTQGWARELWLDALGLPSVLPPPEEAQDVRSAMAAARAKSQRQRML
jgi:rubrerythrin